MRKLFLAFVALLAFAGSAQAALVVHVPDVSALPGSSGTFDVYVEETGGDNFTLSSWNVGFRLSSGGTVTITNITAPSAAHPAIFNNTVLSRYSDPPILQPVGYVAGRDETAANDGSNTAVVNGTRDGLFEVSYTVSSNPSQSTIGMNIDLDHTFFFDPNAEAIPFIVENGSFTVPEPSAMALALFALPLLGRRRR